MRLRIAVLVWGLAADAATAEPILKERDRGAHSIIYEVTLAVPPAEAFRLWSTAEGLERFLAPGARVDGTVGGLYQITFDPEGDPDGAKHGTKGARLLHHVPGRELAAEWTFPPLGQKLNTPPFPTWIELRFDEAPGLPGHTRLRFAHYGFPADPDWEKAWSYFDEGNWPLVLNRLVVHCRDGVSPVWDDPEKDQIDRFIRKEVTVDAPVEAVWSAWTTPRGPLFVAAGTRIEPVPGGAYEWYFSLDAPEGSRGGEGNRLLSIDPMRSLAFEWNAPPSFPAVRPERHQVLVRLEPDGETATRVVLTSLGFGAGPEWSDVHAYFENAWDTVLTRLKAGLEAGP